MISLGGVALSNSLQWVNRYESLRVAQTVRRTTGGGVRVYQQRLYAGIPIVLEANEETGWFTNQMRTGILSLADQLNLSFEFVFFGEIYSVVFNHEQPPAVTFTKIIYRQIPSAEDYFMGKILLLTV